MIRRSAYVVFVLSLCLALPSAAQEPPSNSQKAVDERLAGEHQGDEPVPTPAAEAGTAAAVESEEVAYGDGANGFLARPAGAQGPLPGLIVIHEWWGLNDNIRAVARRLAGQGYLALAVDLYGGEVASTPEKARELTGKVRNDPDAARANLRQAHAYLKTLGATKIGTIGWCFGGGWSLQAGLLLASQVDATVIYYGRLVTDPEKLMALRAPVLGLFGSEDQGIPVETVREFEKAMKELGKDVRVHVYEGASHAFANPSGTRYNAEAAEDAWAKTLAFLDETLKG